MYFVNDIIFFLLTEIFISVGKESEYTRKRKKKTLSFELNVLLFTA